MTARDWPQWAFDSSKFNLKIKIPYPRRRDSHDDLRAYWVISDQHTMLQRHFAAIVFTTQFNRRQPSPPVGYKERIDQLEKDYDAFVESYVIYCLTYQ